MNLRANILLLAACQALLLTNGVTLIVMSLPFLIACASVLLWLARVRKRAEFRGQ